MCCGPRAFPAWNSRRFTECPAIWFPRCPTASLQLPPSAWACRSSPATGELQRQESRPFGEQYEANRAERIRSRPWAQLCANSGQPRRESAAADGCRGKGTPRINGGSVRLEAKGTPCAASKDSGPPIRDATLCFHVCARFESQRLPIAPGLPCFSVATDSIEQRTRNRMFILSRPLFP